MFIELMIMRFCTTNLEFYKALFLEGKEGISSECKDWIHRMDTFIQPLYIFLSKFPMKRNYPFTILAFRIKFRSIFKPNPGPEGT